MPNDANPIETFCAMLTILIRDSSEEELTRATELATKLRDFTIGLKNRDITIAVGIMAAALAKNYMICEARGDFDEEYQA